MAEPLHPFLKAIQETKWEKVERILHRPEFKDYKTDDWHKLLVQSLYIVASSRVSETLMDKLLSHFIPKILHDTSDIDALFTPSLYERYITNRKQTQKLSDYFLSKITPKNVNIDIVNRYGLLATRSTILTTALRSSTIDLGIVNRLLAIKADATRVSITPWDLCTNFDKSMIILGAKGDVNQAAEGTWCIFRGVHISTTPLFSLAGYELSDEDLTKFLKILIDHGANINFVGDDGMTILHHLAKHSGLRRIQNSLLFFRILMSTCTFKFNVHQRDTWKGTTVIQDLLILSDTYRAPIDWAFIATLIDYNADPNDTTPCKLSTHPYGSMITVAQALTIDGLIVGNYRTTILNSLERARQRIVSKMQDSNLNLIEPLMYLIASY
jgi:hypothetical protein